MNYSSKKIAKAAAVPENLQLMQDIRRYPPLHARRLNGSNRSNLPIFAIAVTTSELREFGLSLALLVASSAVSFWTICLIK